MNKDEIKEFDKIVTLKCEHFTFGMRDKVLAWISSKKSFWEREAIDKYKKAETEMKRNINHQLICGDGTGKITEHTVFCPYQGTSYQLNDEIK